MKFLKIISLMLIVVIFNSCSKNNNINQPEESQSPLIETYKSLADFQNLPLLKKSREEILEGESPDVSVNIKSRASNARAVNSTECIEVLFDGEEEYLSEYEGITFSPALYTIYYYAKQWNPVTITFPKSVTFVSLEVWGSTSLFAYDADGELIGSASGGGDWSTLDFAAPADRLVKSIVVHDYLGLYYDWFMSSMKVCYYWNEAPIANAGLDQTIEYNGDTNSFTLDGSASIDPDDDSITYSWSLDGNEVSTDMSPTLSLGAGVYTFILTVTDPDGLSNNDEVTITVLSDASPPEVDFKLITNSLWPVNHKLILVASGITANDSSCDATISVTVTSNEFVNDVGDGDTDPDYEVVENNDGSLDVYLRAERSAKGTGRVYTIAVSAEDCAGNITTQTAEVTVPKSQKDGKK